MSIYVYIYIYMCVYHDCRGYYTCLLEDGAVYDTTKYGWLHGRQVWALAKLYNDVPRFHRPDVLYAAKHGNKLLYACVAGLNLNWQKTLHRHLAMSQAQP